MFTKKTRIVSLLVTIVMLISMVAGFSIVVTANTGSATPIDSADDFASIELDGNYILTADIDFSGVSHTPIGTIDAPFTGTFDGDGYIIKNLTLASDDNFRGLFGVNKGTIKKVTMDSSCSISGNAYVGAIAGKNLSGGIIENCISEATVSYTASSTVGGTYKVMTQNLCQWGDSEFAAYDTYLTSSSQLSRRPGMLARIKEVSPDLIAFQENSFTNTNTVSNDASWWENLTGRNTNTVTAWKTVLENDSELKSTYTFFGSQGSLKADPNEGATVAYRTDKFNLLTSGTFWHSTNPDAPIEQQDANWNVVQDNGEKWGFGAGNKRVVNWVALQDKTTAQKIVLYSLHPQHDSEEVRQKEIPVLIAKMDALRKTYPDAIFIAAGDYNASKGVVSYNMVDNYLSGEMDNVRDIATSYVDGSDKKNTSGNIHVGATGTIDHILIDGSAANVTSFEIRDELYDTLGTKYAAGDITTNADSMYAGPSDTLITRTTPLRPSDHNGVVATFETRTNYAIGGVAGENDGTIRQIVTKATAPEGHGSAIGVNNNAAVAVYGTGTVIANGTTAGAAALPAEPTLEVLWKLNHSAGEDVFAEVENDYAIIHSNQEIDTPVRVRVNQVDYYTMPNSGSFDLDQLGIGDPHLIQDGKLIDNPTITVGTEDIDVSVADSIMNVTKMGTTNAKDFVIKTQDELEYADSKLSTFNKADVVLYLGADIDLTDTTFDGFSGNVLFSFNGMGKTIKNWNKASLGFFHTGYQGKYIKNVNFENVHLSGGYGRSVVVAMAAGTVDFLMENVHLNNCSTTATGSGNLGGLIYTHYNDPYPKTVTIRNISVVDCAIKRSTFDFTNSGVINGRAGNGVDYKISGVYIDGFKNYANTQAETNNGGGFLLGTLEGNTTTIDNIGIFNSKHLIAETEEDALGSVTVGRQTGGTLKATNVFTYGTNAGAFHGRTGGTRSFSGCYTDLEVREVTLESAAQAKITATDTEMSGFTAINAAKMAETVYNFNEALTSPVMYWEMGDAGTPVAATAEERTRKVTVKTDEGDTVSYVDGGETLTISENAEDFFYVIDGNGSVNGGVLTVSTDMDTVVRQIAKTDPAYRVIEELDYFEGKNPDYFENSDDIAAAIETLEQGLKEGIYTSDALVDAALPVLTVYKSGAGYTYVTPDGADKVLPSVQEIEKYDDAPGYMINNVDDLLYVKSIEGGFTVDHTLYLGADLDLKGVSFAGFFDAKFSFDGLGHKIMNWGTAADGTTKAPISTRGFFQSAYNGVAYIKFIKNLTMENCHTTSGNTCSAMLYATWHDNPGAGASSATNLTLENIHFKNSSIKVTGGEGIAFLLSRYSVQTKDATVNVKNCSVIGSTYDASTSGGGHYGLLIGKPRSNNNGNTTTYNLADCYLADNTMITNRTDAAYQGLVIGTAENAGGTGGLTKVTATNIGVFNNTYNVQGATQVNLFGDVQNSSDAILNGVIYQGNTVTGTKNPSVVLFNNGAKANLTNVYSDNNLASVARSGSAALTGKVDAIESGKAAAEVNAGVADQTLYWTTNEDGEVELSTLANSTHKAVLKLANGKVVGNAYANGGEQVTLKVNADPDATFSNATAGSLSGNVLTMPTNGAVVTVTVTPSGNQFDYMGYPAVSTVKAALTAGGNYTIYNEADWDYLETNISYFQRQDITIHLAADIDLSKVSFAGFQEPSFSFDGHNHTVSGWGSTSVYASATAMFVFDGAAANGGTNFIKNLNIENCYVSGRAILVGGVSSNGGFAGLSTNFTVENVHIKNSGLKGNTNFNAFFIGGYASTTADYTVNLKNCSLIDSTMVGGGSGHAGMLIGKITGSGTATKPTYNVTNIYMEGNTYTAGRASAHYEGMIIGNVEVNSTVNVKNLVAIGNTAIYKHTAATTAIAYFGNFDQGTAILDGIVLLDNSISNTTDASAKKYLFTANNAPKFTVGNVYCDDAALVGDNEKLTTLITKRGDVDIVSGEAAAAANAIASADSIYYWRTEEGKLVQSDLANSTHKAELVLANGAVLKSYYANGGEKVILEVEEDLKATFARADGSSGSVSGRTLTMPTDGTVARVVVTPSDASLFAAYGYTSVSAVDTSAARTETNFTVANATEWMKVFNNKAYFSNSAVTIHLIADINLAESVASTFSGFTEVAFAFDGHGHTISNWKYSGNSLGLFGHYKVGTLKNFNLDNCHVKGPYGRALIIGTSNGANAPATSAYALAGNITMENIHVRNCSVDANTGGNLGGIFMGQATAGYTITIRDCSVIDTELKSTKENGITNSGIICGRFGKSTETYVVENLFVDGLMNNANPDTASQGNGILFGTAESGKAKATLTNIVLVNCGGTAASEIVGKQYNDRSIVIKNMLAFNNDTLALNCTSEATIGTSGLIFNNVITDTENVITNSTDGAMIATKAGVTKQKLEEVDMLTFAGTMNDTLTAANGYKSWTVNKDGIAVYATEANATRKVSYQVGGREIGKVYANGGSQITLGLANDPKATFALGANDAGTLDGKELTLPTVGYMVVPITVGTEDSALATVYGYPSVTTVTEDAHRTGLNYTIANAAEWMHFFGQYNHFQSTDVTIHIIGEVDLAGKTAEEFYTASESALGSGIRYSSFMNSAFSMDGHGNTIKNWGTKDVPMPTMGLYRYNGSAAGLNFIKNLVIDNWHTTGSGGSDTTFLVTLNGSDNTGRNNLSDNLVIENVHIKNSSMKAEDRRSGFFVANYVKADGDYSVTLKNCSLTDSTLNGAGGGHEGLLIGKASSFNGKKATYNLINIYVARNIHNAKRGDGYVGLGIGNTEINSSAVAQMKVNMSNVVFEDNTLNSVSATPAIFGQFVGTELNADGVVFANNTVTSTVAMTARTIFTAGATTQNIDGLYHDDANVTKAFGNGNNTGVKYGEEYMTSGEAAAAANVAGEDSVFFYTTTDEGVDLCSEAEATRRVVYAVDDREVEFIGYANGGEEIEIREYAYDPAATLKFEGAEVDDSFTVPTAGYMMVPIDVKTTGNSTLTTVYNYPAVTTVSAAKTSGDYTVANAEEWMYVYNNKAFFNNLGVTLHLIGTIDLSEGVANSFAGFKELQSSFDGHDHTIKNWGTEEAPKNSRGIFYTLNGTGHGAPNYLKNMKVENCHNYVSGATRGAAVFYGFYAANAGITNGPEAFLVENVHLSNCSFVGGADDDYALLVARYNVSGKTSTATIKGCSVIDSKMDLTAQTATGTKGHAGTLWGKSPGGAGGDDKVQILDCYIRGVEITEANNYTGLVTGTAESGATTINNIAVVDSTITAAKGKEAYLLAPYTGGDLYARYNLFQGNTVTSDTGRYFVGSNNTSACAGGSINDSNLCDQADLSDPYNATKKVGAVEGLAGKHLKRNLTPAHFSSGEMVYLNNTYTAKKDGYDIIDQRELFWTLDAEKKIIPADGNQTRKVTFTVVDDEGKASTSQVYTYYTDYTKKLIPEFDSFLYKNYEWTNSASEKYTLDTTFTADAAYTAVGVVLDELQAAINYFNGKDLAKYFVDAEGIQALLDGVKTKIAENEYQESENTVPGLGFASLDKDLKLVKERHATYQTPNETYSNVPTVGMIGTYADSPNYTINSLAEFKTAKSNELKYPRGSTLHLMTDLDLSGYAFPGFSKTYFNFDGHNNTISNWTYSADAQGVSFISRGAANSIKNLTFDTVNLTGTGHLAVVYGSHNSDNTNDAFKLADGKGVSGTLTFENIHVKNATLNAQAEQAAIFLPNTQSGRTGYVFNNCSIEDSTINAVNSISNLSGFVARLSSNAAVTITNSMIDGFSITGNPTLNITPLVGETQQAHVVVAENVGVFNVDIKSTSDIFLAPCRTVGGAAAVVTLKNLMFGNINATPGEGKGVYLSRGNLDNYQFTEVETGKTVGSGHHTVNIYIDEALDAQLIDGKEIYHNHTTSSSKTPIVLPDEEFKSGEAAWKANQVLALAEKTARWEVGEHGNYPMIDSLAADDWAVPYQVLLTDNRTSTANTTEHYSAGDGLLNAEGKERMGSFSWLDAESTAYTAATPYTADTKLTLESIINIDVTWGEMQFVYDFGEWDEDNCVWLDYGWELETDTDNKITLTNNGTVYKELSLTYEKADGEFGLSGIFTDVNDADAGDLTAIPMNADGTSATYKFMLDEIPAETWDDEAKTVGNLTVAIN